MAEFFNRQWRLPNNENKDKQSNYSMDFDGADDYIDAGSSVGVIGTGVRTFSVWLKTSVTGTQVVLGTRNANTDGWVIQIELNTILFYNVLGGANKGIYTTATNLTDGNWYHLTIVRAGTGNNKIYVNGVPQTLNTTTFGDENLSDPQSSKDLLIGAGYNTNSVLYRFFDGQIDAVSIYNYALSQSQITTLYGSSSTGIGNPMSLSPKPVAFYPLGDQDVYNGASYLVPNAAVVGGFSPYALDFDGTSNYIDCGQNTNLDTGDLSASIWINKNSAGSGTQYIFNNNSGSAVAGFAFNMLASNVIGIGRRTRTYGAFSGYLNVSFTDDVWHNLSFSYNDTTKALEVWFNGNSVHTSTATSSSSVASQNIIIGDRANLTGFNFNGSLSNASIWNTALTAPQITEIYNSGVPSNLNNHSAYSNLVSWWQLGSNSSFNNTVWTVLDEKGTNNGVSSTNMSEVDIVNGVGYSSNGVSSGMSDNVIGDAPYSTANSLSVNMDVLDRTTDIPS